MASNDRREYGLINDAIIQSNLPRSGLEVKLLESLDSNYKALKRWIF